MAYDDFHKLALRAEVLACELGYDHLGLKTPERQLAELLQETLEALARVQDVFNGVQND